jgi:hypothetical protein
LAAALALASTAVAQTPENEATVTPAPVAVVPADSPCANLTTPAGPVIPDGASATGTQMQETADQYTAWGNDRLARLQACRTEVQAARAMAEALAAAYTASNAELGAITAQFETEVAEFNAR